MRSMYSGVSGLRAHQLKMDVIGNNIANVNTVGFKSSQASFQQVFSQTSSGASAPQGGRGGTNPQQVGLGVSMGSIRVNHTPGSAQRTDNPLDFFIGGDGYFVVSGDSNFNNRSYTRAGNFDLDRDGTLVTGEGLKVLGYKMQDDGTISDELGAIVIDQSTAVDATTTENIKFKGNLDARTEIYLKDKNGNYVNEAGEEVDEPVLITDDKDREMFSTDTVMYDSLGNPHNIKFKMKRTDVNKWTASVEKIDGAEFVEGNASFDLEFNSKGELISGDTGSLIVTKEGVRFGDAEKDDDEGEITIDFSGLTQYGNDTTAKASSPDGNTSGNIESFSVSKSGEIVAVYTNGESKVLAQVALAKFDNPGGLSSEGSNLFKDTRNSGEAQFGKAGGAGYGQMLGGAVEMSNVDLSNEFTEMITTQRGFQANSRIITTSDEMLQELMSLKR